MFKDTEAFLGLRIIPLWLKDVLYKNTTMMVIRTVREKAIAITQMGRNYYIVN